MSSIVKGVTKINFHWHVFPSFLILSSFLHRRFPRWNRTQNYSSVIHQEMIRKKKKKKEKENGEEKNHSQEVGIMTKKQKTIGTKITKTPRFIFSKYFYSPYTLTTSEKKKNLTSCFTCFLTLLFLMSQSIRCMFITVPLCTQSTKSDWKSALASLFTVTRTINENSKEKTKINNELLHLHKLPRFLSSSIFFLFKLWFTLARADYYD